MLYFIIGKGSHLCTENLKNGHDLCCFPLFNWGPGPSAPFPKSTTKHCITDLGGTTPCKLKVEDYRVIVLL